MDPLVFISYAHADDQAFDDDTRGWITDFVDKLQKAIRMKAGGSRVRCWMDHRLEPQRDVDDTLRKRILDDSRCILAFMSPRYLESQWCGKEMATFVELIGGGKANDRVFLVELLPTERRAWHSGIQSITAIKFWNDAFDQPEAMTLGWPVPDPKVDKAYWRKLNNLASILARQIQGLPPAGPATSSASFALSKPYMPPGGSAPASPAVKFVWIADPTDDVLDQWESLSADLQKQGYGVLPQAMGHYPVRDEALYRQALNKDLVQANLLVQLLGSLPGKKPAWADVRFVQIQAAAAKIEAERRKIAFLSWRRTETDMNSIADLGFKSLLAAATAPDFDAFCREIIEGLAAVPSCAPPPASGPLSVVINADQPDRDLGKQARDLLAGLAVDATLVAEPLPSQPPGQYRHHLEEQLEYNHGVLIVYGMTPPSWVQAQHAMARKVLALRRTGIWGALLEGPPEHKPKHGLEKSRSLMVLDCRQGLRVDPLKVFVDSLRHGLAHV